MDEQETNNTPKTLFELSNIVLDYLVNNNVVLYYYCDISPLYIRNTRQITMSTQEYRSILFSKVFERSNPGNYREKTVRISDPENGDHFTTLIFHEENQNIIEEIEEDLKSLEK